MKQPQPAPVQVQRPASAACILNPNGRQLLDAHYARRQQGYAELGGLTITQALFVQSLTGGNIF